MASFEKMLTEILAQATNKAHEAAIDAARLNPDKYAKTYTDTFDEVYTSISETLAKEFNIKLKKEK